MKWQRPIACFVIAACCLARAQQPTTQPLLIDATDKAALQRAMGQEVTITGTISAAAWSRSGAVMNIDFAGAGNSRFFAVIFERNKESFNTAFSGDFGKTLVGAKVRLRGRLELYGGQQESFKGRPQIVLSRPDQVTVVEPARH